MSSDCSDSSVDDHCLNSTVNAILRRVSAQLSKAHCPSVPGERTVRYARSLGGSPTSKSGMGSKSGGTTVRLALSEKSSSRE